jgi:hypothetical protein
VLPDHLKRNADELAKIRSLVESGLDCPVLMLNENTYSSDAGYPSGQLYRQYISGLEALVTEFEGRILWRLAVLGQPVGQGRQSDEILAIWYPSHKAYLDLPSAAGGPENYRLRGLCVEHARIHRCHGEAYPTPLRASCV